MSEAISLPAGSVDMNALHDACMKKTPAERDKAVEKVLAAAAPEAAVEVAPAVEPAPAGVE
jgi:hypothetical protein